jgi:hypothetical protein
MEEQGWSGRVGLLNILQLHTKFRLDKGVHAHAVVLGMMICRLPYCTEMTVKIQVMRSLLMRRHMLMTYHVFDSITYETMLTRL